MKQTKDTHTPGPWKVVYEGSGPQCRPAIIHADMLEVIVDRRRDMADPMPDARLITAAPALLEALELVVIHSDDMPVPYREKAYAAIRAAKGETA